MIGYAAVAGVLAALSFAYLFVLAPPRGVDPGEREIALTLAAGIAVLAAEIIGYNVTWPTANRARYFYPALGPLVILPALAVRHAAARLRSTHAGKWGPALLVLALALAWTLSFRSGLLGFHSEG